ncbi:MAG: lysophospholipid acyltransferase family protein [Candidatus Eiseniibacteriota bacterium]|nr:MAG: lysophospholipid acyltransferase family protein [Candidatus Eisenbacteria bacterium]
MKRFLSHPLEYLLTISLVRALQLLPHETALRFGCLLGSFVFSVARFRRGIVLGNLRNAFPEKEEEEILRIAKDTYRNFAMSLVEYARLPVTSAEEMRERITIEGLQNFDKALERSGGAVLVTGHFGSWELMGASLIAYGYPVSFLVGEQKNKAVDDLMNRLRTSKGIGIIKMGAAMRNVLKALKGNQFVAMLCDQDAGKHGVFVEFLGRPASTPMGPASFALRTGACLIAGFILRENLSRHRVVLEEPMLPESTGDREEDVRRYTQAHTSLLEKYVLQRPDHWLWLHRRWKTRPRPAARSRSLSVSRPGKEA